MTASTDKSFCETDSIVCSPAGAVFESAEMFCSEMGFPVRVNGYNGVPAVKRAGKAYYTEQMQERKRRKKENKDSWFSWVGDLW